MRRNVLATVLIACGIFGFMLVLNHLMPIHRDDYDYSMIWKTGAHVASFGDVFDSAYRHYFLHGGRMVTVLALSLFLWLGKGFFDIANALMFLALAVLLAMHARRTLAFWHASSLLGVAGGLLWLVLPHFGEVAVWKSGSTVYLWSAVPAFLFLLPYNIGLRMLAEGRSLRVPLGALLMFPLGVLAGWSVENLAVTVVLTAAGVSLYVKKTYKTLPLWMPAGTLGALVGLIGLVAAPGNFARYSEQGTGKGVLLHIGNQFAGQGEMALYLLPVLLILLTAWRLYRRACAGLVQRTVHAGAGAGTALLAALLILLVVSYFTGGFIASAIRDAMIFHAMVPLGIAAPKTVHLFTNVMNGFEEMAIYWLAILLFYTRLRQVLGLSADAVRSAAARVPAREVLRAYPAARYAALLMALSLCNNLVMLAAPTFPGRATFSSAAMFVAAALAVLYDAPIRSALRGAACRTLRAAAMMLLTFTAAGALLITHEMGEADAVRISLIKDALARGETTVHMPPITRTNRALRHVFYEDWDNKVTSEGAMEFFGLREIIVDGK